MSETIYLWGARSPSKGFHFHEMNPGQPLVTNKQLAWRFAESFATRLNEKNHMQINDWVGLVDERQHRPGTSNLQ